ncbi:hypothetical protein CH63R_00931 [Colletotrichum higginsianum IMI 349063]|uniref:Uncharacterized protein n=1 Tax=Colletotrichum higginsianum (strain IMI 349063) TaxID=759273 RepID=A0A1B7YUN1_COLHI|nr:hypothetical protein CH63R_00931 [Colletotrichum higginsianum IMI 349063]OBR15751.1 hypothetical protein CH63R_00931 [Colletotrichum higginsianum IMI 349063]
MQARKQRPSGNSLCACRFGYSRLPQRPAFEFESLGCDAGQALRRSGGLRLGTDPEKPETRGLVSALPLAQYRVPSQRMPGLPAVDAIQDAWVRGAADETVRIALYYRLLVWPQQ